MHIFNSILIAFNIGWLMSVAAGIFITNHFYHGDVDEYMENCHPLFVIFIGRGVWVFLISVLYLIFKLL